MSASFAEVQFPPGISQGAVGGPRFSTSILSLSSGYESRNINWKNARGEWDVSFGLQTQEQVDQLIDFFNARRGKAFAFRFKDWTDYRLPRWRATPGDMDALPVFFTTDGVTNTFQLTKAYSDAGGTYIRTIAKPVNVAICSAGCTPLQLLNDGTQMVNPTDFTVDTTTGIVTLSPAIAATVGALIAGACEFDVPARFDTDDMKITITTTEIMAWPSIPVVETRDI
jgi:uncharacterized protein (TIGR02217 family)